MRRGFTVRRSLRAHPNTAQKHPDTAFGVLGIRLRQGDVELDGRYRTFLIIRDDLRRRYISVCFDRSDYCTVLRSLDSCLGNACCNLAQCSRNKVLKVHTLLQLETVGRQSGRHYGRTGAVRVVRRRKFVSPDCDALSSARRRGAAPKAQSFDAIRSTIASRSSAVSVGHASMTRARSGSAPPARRASGVEAGRSAESAPDSAPPSVVRCRFVGIDWGCSNPVAPTHDGDPSRRVSFQAIGRPAAGLARAS